MLVTNKQNCQNFRCCNLYQVRDLLQCKKLQIDVHFGATSIRFEGIDGVALLSEVPSFTFFAVKLPQTYNVPG